jgi:hypothetical protein
MTDVHQNYASDWETPQEWCDWVNATLGTVDLDPCGSASSLDRLRAGMSYLGEPGFKSGLDHAWFGNVYCNPPGANSSKSVKRWWRKLNESVPGVLEHVVWCFFNNEHTRFLDRSPWDMSGWMVMPKKRVAFLRDGKPVKSPRNWTWFWTTKEPAKPPIDSLIVRTG